MNNINILNVFSDHNRHWELSLPEYEKEDPQLRKLALLKYQFDYPFDRDFNPSRPGVYILVGGRQLGKSTSLKKLIRRLVGQGVPSLTIMYLACDKVLDRFDLYNYANEFLDQHKGNSTYLLIDEASYVPGWDLCIKALYDEGKLEGCACIISGSDKVLLEDAITRLAGRRGSAEKLDWELSPLSFYEFLTLLAREKSFLDAPADERAKLFDDYLRTGGYVVAINDYMVSSTISPAVYKTYQDWIVGDMLRLGKKAPMLYQVITAILRTYGSQVSYQNLAEHTDGISKDTIQEYCHLLERLSVLQVQYALDQNSLSAAPKKNKKFYFSDPFILRAVQQLVSEKNQRTGLPEDSYKVEGVVLRHLSKRYPTYYIKAEGEVDMAWVDSNMFFPAEIKWRNQIRAVDLKQIAKYSNGIVLTKEPEARQIHGVPCSYLVDFLYKIG